MTTVLGHRALNRALLARQLLLERRAMPASPAADVPRRACRELVDVPDGALPDPDAPVPPRFLPAFDNAVLAYVDRTRIIDDADRGLSVEGARFVLVDGRVSATWTTAGDSDGTVLRITPRRRLGTGDRDVIVDEGERLLAFLTDGAAGRVEILAQ